MTNIQEISSQLRLSYIRDNAETLISEARQTQPDYADFLQNLLLREVERRTENGITRRIKDARFPVKKYLVDFDKDKYDKAFIPKFKEPETLGFIENKENIILIGTPGAGKPTTPPPLASPLAWAFLARTIQLAYSVLLR